jgi:hypothetical protein
VSKVYLLWFLCVLQKHVFVCYLFRWRLERWGCGGQIGIGGRSGCLNMLMVGVGFFSNCVLEMFGRSFALEMVYR